MQTCVPVVPVPAHTTPNELHVPVPPGQLYWQSLPHGAALWNVSGET